MGLLKARGLRVAVIKHASKGFDLDKPGKDSWRFGQAGADAVVLVGGGRMAILKKIDLDPDCGDMERTVDADIVLYEGFKKSVRNKIEVFRAGVSGERPLCMQDPSSYIALVTDGKYDVSVPVFDLYDAEGVVEFIVKKTGPLLSCNAKLRL